MLAHQHQQQGAGARMLAGVPLATAFTALARSEMNRKRITTRVLGQMRHDG
ncbi:hypothetical protein OG458_07200 [Streptomyces sp. NBC_01281]|uniref:hypothetical protein n=1 Tax=Streptomyces sp. NBC_01281 TaxID=2903811 RepID=UPI002E12C1F6|nr:hypothetical protein OG458_07200 [Streptomyces sp. NBC_01281]